MDSQELNTLFKYLRTKYDLILLYTEAALENESFIMFSSLADSSVIVVEAERTRSHVVKRLSSIINANGGSVIGAILNKRRFYTPSWIYKLLFSAFRN